jgi:DNA-binding response OmpR family regulator
MRCAAGFDDYLTKPIDVRELLRCLERHLAAPG